MKKLVAVVMAVLLVLSMTACGGGQSNTSSKAETKNESAAPGKAEFTIRYSHCNSEGSLVYMVAEYFEKTLEEKTGGRIQVDVYPSGQLSSGDDESMNNLMSGIFEMSPSAPSSLAKSSGVVGFNILDFPYMFSGVDESLKLCRSELWDELEKEFEAKTNVKPLIWYSTGSNAVGNKIHAIEKPSDFEGLKLRTASSDIFVNTVKAMGGNPMAMAFGETFSAIQQGTVDGIVTPFVNFWKEGFYDVTKYVTQLQSSEFYHCLMVTSDFYNGLPDDLKALFDEAVAATDKYAEDLGKQFENETVPKNLKELGVELVQLTAEQKAAFTEATATVRENSKDAVGADFYKKVVDFLGK